jgi:hypothetical protein
MSGAEPMDNKIRSSHAVEVDIRVCSPRVFYPTNTEMISIIAVDMFGGVYSSNEAREIVVVMMS